LTAIWLGGAGAAAAGYRGTFMDPLDSQIIQSVIAAKRRPRHTNNG